MSKSNPKLTTKSESYLGCLRTPYGTTRMWDLNNPMSDSHFLVFVAFLTKTGVLFAYKVSLPKTHAIDSRRSFLAATFWTSLNPEDSYRDDLDSYTPEQLEWAKEYGEELNLWIEEQEAKLR